MDNDNGGDGNDCGGASQSMTGRRMSPIITATGTSKMMSASWGDNMCNVDIIPPARLILLTTIIPYI